MRYGRITQTAWNRSVRRQLHTERSGAGPAASPFTTCSVLPADQGPGDRAERAGCGGSAGPGFLWADAAVSGNSPHTGYYAVLHAAGKLAADRARIRGCSVRFLFPPGTEESLLRELTAGVREACGQVGAQVTALTGEVTPAVRIPTALASGAGVPEPEFREAGALRTGEEKGARKGGRTAGLDLLICGYAGLEGSLRILEESREELGRRFVPAFLDGAAALRRSLVTPDQILSIWRTGEAGGPADPAGSGRGRADGERRAENTGAGRAAAVRQIGSGGILAALWDLGEILDTGMEVDLSKIPLRQETVEICEFYRLNPYQLTSAGSFLIAAERGDEILEVLEKEGVRAGKLGVTKAQNARVVTSGEEVRYLDRPAPDELIRWLAERDGGGN